MKKNLIIMITVSIILSLIVPYINDILRSDDIYKNTTIENRASGISISNDGRIMPLTKLTEEQMNIQKEKGCNTNDCHEK